MSTSSSNSPVALTVELHPSRWLRFWLAVLGLVAFAAILHSGAPSLLAVPLILFTWLYLTLLSRRARSPRWRALRWDGERWLRISADGRSCVVRLRRAVVWPLLMVLELQGPGGKERLVLWPDSAGPDLQRRLRVCLRHLPVYGGVGRAAAGGALAGSRIESAASGSRSG